MSDPFDPEVWKQRAMSFDAQAERYEAARLGYPAELAETIITRAEAQAGDRLLEVGSGTGKATEGFIGRGFDITCVEPGENMAAIARRKFAGQPGLRFIVQPFETAALEPGAYQVLYAGQAWHWVAPDVGYAKASAALKPGGLLALFWNRLADLGSPLAKAFEQVYAGYDAFFYTKADDVEAEVQERQQAIDACGLFEPCQVLRIPWTKTFTTRQYLDLAATYSDHATLPADTRARLFADLEAVIEGFGGSIQRAYQVLLFMARKP